MLSAQYLCDVGQYARFKTEWIVHDGWVRLLMVKGHLIRQRANPLLTLVCTIRPSLFVHPVLCKLTSSKRLQDSIRSEQVHFGCTCLVRGNPAIVY